MLNLWGFFFFTLTDLDLWKVSAEFQGGPSIVFIQTKETECHKQWPSLRYHYRRIKNYLVDIKGVFFQKVFKNPEFKNVLFNLLSMFSIQVLSRRAKKEKWPHCSEIISFKYITACYKKKNKQHLGQRP